jgi:hypothetical protein
MASEALRMPPDMSMGDPSLLLFSSSSLPLFSFSLP